MPTMVAGKFALSPIERRRIRGEEIKSRNRAELAKEVKDLPLWQLGKLLNDYTATFRHNGKRVEETIPAETFVLRVNHSGAMTVIADKRVLLVGGKLPRVQASGRDWQAGWYFVLGYRQPVFIPSLLVELLPEGTPLPPDWENIRNIPPLKKAEEGGP